MFNIITLTLVLRLVHRLQNKNGHLLLLLCVSNMLHTQVNTFGDQPVDYKCQQACFPLSVLKKIICILCALVFA